MWSNRALERALNPTEQAPRLFRPGSPTPADASPRDRGPRGRAASSPRSRALERQGWAGRAGRLWRRRVDYGRRAEGVEYRGGSERSRVTLPVAPRRTPGTLPKNTSPKETSPALKPAHVPDWGAANHNASVSPALLDAPIIPTDGLTDRDTLWLKTVAPLDTDRDGLRRFLGEVVAEVQIDRPGERDQGPEMLPKLPDRWNVSTTSAFAPGAAIRASAATAVVDASRLAHEGSDLCPPASAPNCFISAPTQPLRGPPYGLFAPTPLTTRRLQLNITRRNFFVI